MGTALSAGPVLHHPGADNAVNTLIGEARSAADVLGAQHPHLAARLQAAADRVDRVYNHQVDDMDAPAEGTPLDVHIEVLR